MNHFAAREGSRISDEDANIIGQEIRKVTARLRKLKPHCQGPNASQLVDAASSPKSPLHGFFEWDDAIGGHQWRLQQARVLMGSVVPIFHSGDKVKVRAFRAIRVITTKEAATQTRERQYIEMECIKDNDELKRQTIDAFERDVTNLLKRYEQYASVWLSFRHRYERVAEAIGLSLAPTKKGGAKAGRTKKAA